MKYMSEENINFSTRDLYLAASFISLGLEVINIDFQIEGEKNTPVGYFNFKNSDKLKEAEKDYWSGKLKIEPRSFVNSMRGLKSRVIGIYKNPSSNFEKTN